MRLLSTSSIRSRTSLRAPTRACPLCLRADLLGLADALHRAAPLPRASLETIDALLEDTHALAQVGLVPERATRGTGMDAQLPIAVVAGHAEAQAGLLRAFAEAVATLDGAFEPAGGGVEAARLGAALALDARRSGGRRDAWLVRR